MSLKHSLAATPNPAPNRNHLQVSAHPIHSNVPALRLNIFGDDQQGLGRACYLFERDEVLLDEIFSRDGISALRAQPPFFGIGSK